jgi:hypothetical protein
MAAALVQRGGAAPTQYTPPLARLAGMHRLPTLDAAAKLHVEIELAPKDPELDTFATSVGDP